MRLIGKTLQLIQAKLLKHPLLALLGFALSLICLSLPPLYNPVFRLLFSAVATSCIALLLLLCAKARTSQQTIALGCVFLLLLAVTYIATTQLQFQPKDFPPGAVIGSEDGFVSLD